MIVLFIEIIKYIYKLSLKFLYDILYLLKYII